MVAVFYHDRREHQKGRIAEALTIFYFLGVKSFIVLLAGVPQSIMLGVIGLYKDAACLCAAPGPSGDLRYQLKSALGGTQVRQTETDIYGDDSYKRHIWKIVA